MGIYEKNELENTSYGHIHIFYGELPLIWQIRG